MVFIWYCFFQKKKISQNIGYKTAASVYGELFDSFFVKTAVYQGSLLNSLWMLWQILKMLPCVTSVEELMETYGILKKAFERKGLRVNVGKTKDMKVVDGKKTAA